MIMICHPKARESKMQVFITLGQEAGDHGRGKEGRITLVTGILFDEEPFTKIPLTDDCNSIPLSKGAKFIRFDTSPEVYGIEPPCATTNKKFINHKTVT